MKTIMRLLEQKLEEYAQAGQIRIVTRCDIQFNAIECEYKARVFFADNGIIDISQSGEIQKVQ